MRTAPLIVLVGFMGSGKSSIAAALQSKYELHCFEADELLLERSGFESIAKIFQEKGESWFRSLEKEILKELLQKESGVISTGGGVVEDAENRELLSSSKASVVHLSVDLETVHARIGDPSTRPLFRNPDEVRARFVRREPVYRALADYRFVTDPYTPQEIAAFIAGAVGVTKGSEQCEICSVIGDPIGHSRSPEIHTAALGSNRRTFTAARVAPTSLGAFMEQFREGNIWRGLAVTIPHKVAVQEYCDRLDETASQIGAVNTVVKRDGLLVGYNTDWEGILRPIEKRTSVQGKAALVIGAGGTARAAVYALKRAGADPTVVNRTEGRAEELARDFGVSHAPLGSLDDLKEYEIVVHTTSVGMGTDESLFDREAFRAGQVVLDAVYQPEWTRLLREAESAGAIPVPGSEMFLAQAAAQFALHWGQEPDPDLMKEAYQKDVKDD